MTLKEFFKPNWKKISLTVIALLVLGFMVFRIFSVGLSNKYIPIVFIFGFPLAFFSGFLGMFSSAWRVIGLVLGVVLEFILLYILSCILIGIITFVKNKIVAREWNSKKIVVFTLVLVALIVGIFAYYFFRGVGSNLLVATADDSGATIEGVDQLSKANNQFAIDLYNEINKNSNDENIFFSPWSISTAVAMVYEGARGETASEIQNVFHFPKEDNVRRSSYAKMLNTLNKAGGKYELKTANAVWLQKDYPFLENYKETIKKYYLGEVKNYDIAGNPNGASSEINKWVSKNTNNKIKEIVSPGAFNDMSRVVLANAIYFKGKWEHKFDRKDTKEEEFTLESGSKISVPMMKLEDKKLKFNYTESDGTQILEMPYQGDKISMLVLLPRTKMDETNLRIYGEYKTEHQIGNLSHLESILTEEKLREWRKKMRSETVYIYMPKYTFETSYSLQDPLKDIGMNLPFTWPGADFSGIDGTKLLYINQVLHKAYIDVYEEGTEAAAATTISMETAAARPRYIEFKADHPFIFLIQERETGNILFMGKVNNPNE